MKRFVKKHIRKLVFLFSVLLLLLVIIWSLLIFGLPLFIYDKLPGFVKVENIEVKPFKKQIHFKNIQIYAEPGCEKPLLADMGWLHIDVDPYEAVVNSVSLGDVQIFTHRHKENKKLCSIPSSGIKTQSQNLPRGLQELQNIWAYRIKVKPNDFPWELNLKKITIDLRDRQKYTVEVDATDNLKGQIYLQADVLLNNKSLNKEALKDIQVNGELHLKYPDLTSLKKLPQVKNSSLAIRSGGMNYSMSFTIKDRQINGLHTVVFHDLDLYRKRKPEGLSSLLSYKPNHLLRLLEQSPGTLITRARVKGKITEPGQQYVRRVVASIRYILIRRAKTKIEEITSNMKFWEF